MRIVSLHVYPVKGTRAHDIARAELTPLGLAGDRRWAIADASGLFASQRSHPRLAQITAVPAPSGLELSADGMEKLTVAIPDGRARMPVTVWEHRIDAALAAPAARDWISRFFGEPMRLVHMDARSERQKQGVWTDAPLPISFADAYPVLIATTGSLAAVNAEIERKGGAAVPMRRFRPNIVIDSDEPWAEDFWRRIRIGNAELDLVKPCDRCIVTTKDQTTGESTGDEPLAALRTLRMSADPRVKGVLFGWNAVPTSLASIAVGDEVEVLTPRREGFPIRSSQSLSSRD